MKLFLKAMMKGILKLVAKANQWYEKLEEPKRFIVAACYGLLPFMFLSGLASASSEGILYVFGLLWIIIFVIVPRAFWLYGNLRDYLDY